MSIESVRNYLKQYDASERILEFSVSSATVDLAAQALHTQPGRIAKTLSFLLKDGSCILIVMAGDKRLDNSKYKAYFHTKAKMLTADEVLEKTGHPIGGVCPFAVPETVKIFLDRSLKEHQTVFPACGSPNSAIELSADELFRFSHADSWIDVSQSISPV